MMTEALPYTMNRDDVNSDRRAAWDRFMKTGFPTPRQEAWRFTNVSFLSRTPFPVLPSPKDRTAIKAKIDRVTLPGAIRICFLNGRLETDWSELSAVPGLNIVIHRESEFPQMDQRDTNAFVDWNRALARESLQVRVSAGIRVDRPVQIIWFTANETDANGASHSQLLLRTEAGSEVSVTETFLSEGKGKTLTNHREEIILGDDSRLSLYQIREGGTGALHFSYQNIIQNANSRLAMTHLTTGGKLTRVDSRIRQVGSHGETSYNILNLVKDQHHCDYHTTVHHHAGHGNSDETAKIILRDSSRAVFNGRIIVEEGACGTNANQTNKNILLSETARVNAIPQLEIYNDDVACSHGTTTGELDDDALFYLRSRGISERDARAILLMGFAEDILDAVPAENIREAFAQRLHQWLEANEI
ncbi:MAG: Fe-S cluster assembly protein SufD [Fidelibacterota bacterium]